MKALYWLTHEDHGAISFSMCCEVLAVNPEVVRRRILASPPEGVDDAGDSADIKTSILRGVA